MGYQCNILADSVSPTGVRLTTFELTFPRFILAEVNTHRMASRNAASSRARPLTKVIEGLLTDAVTPIFQKNRKGMQSTEPLTPAEQQAAASYWYEWMTDSIARAEYMSDTWGIHKQWVNRPLEAWQWVTDIFSMTDLDNFFALRCHKDAQPEFQIVAKMMRAAQQGSTPDKLEFGEWHLPLVYSEDRLSFHVSELVKISAGRCCRVSYLTHTGVRDPYEDIALHDRLVRKGSEELAPMHMSPLEHQAFPVPPTDGRLSYRLDQLEATNPFGSQTPLPVVPKPGAIGYCGNFKGYIQYRKTLENENIEDCRQYLE